MPLRHEGKTAFRRHVLVKRRRTSRLNHRQPRQLINQPQRQHLPQALTERRDVTQISARQHNPVRHLPVPLVHHLDYNRLLALNTKRVDRVQQIDPQPFCQNPNQRQNLVKVRIHLECLRAVLQSLRQLAVGDVPVRDEDQRLQTARARISRHGSRSIPGRNTSDPLHPQQASLCRPRRHPVVLKRPGRIKTLMLEGNRLQTTVSRSPRGREERRVALPQRHHMLRVFQKREQFPVTPNAALLQRSIIHTTLTPKLLQRSCISANRSVSRLQQTATLRAIVEDIADVVLRATSRFKTNEMSLHGRELPFYRLLSAQDRHPRVQHGFRAGASHRETEFHRFRCRPDHLHNRFQLPHLNFNRNLDGHIV